MVEYAWKLCVHTMEIVKMHILDYALLGAIAETSSGQTPATEFQLA